MSKIINEKANFEIKDRKGGDSFKYIDARTLTETELRQLLADSSVDTGTKAVCYYLLHNEELFVTDPDDWMYYCIANSTEVGTFSVYAELIGKMKTDLTDSTLPDQERLDLWSVNTALAENSWFPITTNYEQLMAVFKELLADI